MSVDRFELAKQEYIKLKDEQTKRIGFRDNLLYVNLLLMSGIFSFAFADKNAGHWQYHGLLIAGWVALVLGWTYVVNDEKISAIGRYIRKDLASSLDSRSWETVFPWELAHADDKHRVHRKWEQLIVDEISFPGIGLFSIVFFWMLAPEHGVLTTILGLIEMMLLIVLGWEIWVYADLARRHPEEEQKRSA